MCTKPIGKEQEVFLIDHAWTFSQHEALHQLTTNDALVERITKIVETWEKQELPEASAKPKLPIEVAFEQELQKGGGKVFNLDGLGIEDLSTLPFPE